MSADAAPHRKATVGRPEVISSSPADSWVAQIGSYERLSSRRRAVASAKSLLLSASSSALSRPSMSWPDELPFIAWNMTSLRLPMPPNAINKCSRPCRSRLAIRSRSTLSQAAQWCAPCLASSADASSSATSRSASRPSNSSSFTRAECPVCAPDATVVLEEHWCTPPHHIAILTKCCIPTGNQHDPCDVQHT